MVGVGTESEVMVSRMANVEGELEQDSSGNSVGLE